MKKRHRGIVRAFYLVVVLPCVIAAAYLYFIAKDQYASTMGFSVRTEDSNSAMELLGGLSNFSGNSGSDTDILFEFMQSQRLVRAVDAKLNLREIYHMPSDPFFGVKQDSSIEELVHFWDRVVKVFYNSTSGLLEVRVTAFDPKSAQTIGAAIYDESSRMINELSAIARNDATRYARQELELAEDRLRKARESVQAFRVRTQIVDPEADLIGRMGIVNTLQEQLATAQVELDLLYQTSGRSDPRVAMAERRVSVIEERLHTERQRLSTDDDNQNAYAKLVGEYEGLSVDLDFAQKAYIASLGTLDASVAEASRKSRYLAAYIEPTLAETPEFPQRLILLTTLVGFLFAAWATGALVFYSLRDRR